MNSDIPVGTRVLLSRFATRVHLRRRCWGTVVEQGVHLGTTTVLRNDGSVAECKCYTGTTTVEWDDRAVIDYWGHTSELIPCPSLSN